MKETIYKQAAIDALIKAASVNYQIEWVHNGLLLAIDVIKALAPISTLEEIEKIYDAGYKRGYLQAEFDYKVERKIDNDQ